MMDQDHKLRRMECGPTEWNRRWNDAYYHWVFVVIRDKKPSRALWRRVERNHYRLMKVGTAKLKQLRDRANIPEN